MQATVTNKILEISNPTQEVLDFCKKNLVYTDKSKEFQLRRMENNPWQANSKEYFELKKQMHGSVYEFDGSNLYIPQGFSGLFARFFPSGYKDLRHETGRKVILPWVKKPFAPRDYQEEAIDILLKKDRYRGIVNLAMGLGKTLTAIHLIQRYKRNALIVCPSDSIARQFYDQCVECFGPNKVGFYGGGKKKINDITVGIAASITRNVDAFIKEDFGLVIFDEIHHIAANTFFNIAEGLAGVGKVFGLTATEYRSDGKDIMIRAGCGPIIIRRDIKWGVDNKYLAEPYFIIREVNTTGRDWKNDKLKSYKEHVLNDNTMRNQILSDAQKMIAAGKSVLVLVDEVAHGKELAEQLGVPFATGTDKNSGLYVDQLNKGKIPGLVGTDGKIGEGTDTKNVDVLILANFVAAKGPVIQAVGRGLRKINAKTKCLVLDYIPLGSTMLSRHARNRIAYYRTMSDKIKVIGV